MENKLQKPAVVGALALISCFFWGSAFPCVKVGYEWFHIEGVGSQILFAGYRFFLAGMFTFLLGGIVEKRILTIRKSSFPYVLGQGMLQTTIQYFFFYIGMANTTGSKGSIISGSNGLASILIAHFLLKSEKMTWQKWIGCILGLSGVVVVNLSPGSWGEGFNIMGEGMIVIAAFSYGFSSITLKLISHRESPFTITAYQLTLGSIILIIAGAVMGGTVSGFTVKSTLLFIYMALLSTFAFSLWTILLKHNPVGRVSIYIFSVPIFGVALSAVILGEQIFSLKNLLALILVSGGIVVVNSKSGRLKKANILSKNDKISDKG